MNLTSTGKSAPVFNIVYKLKHEIKMSISEPILPDGTSEKTSITNS